MSRHKANGIFKHLSLSIFFSFLSHSVCVCACIERESTQYCEAQFPTVVIQIASYHSLLYDMLDKSCLHAHTHSHVHTHAQIVRGTV